MSSDETASKLPVSWGEITKAEAMEVEAEVEVDQLVEDTNTKPAEMKFLPHTTS